MPSCCPIHRGTEPYIREGGKRRGEEEEGREGGRSRESIVQFFGCPVWMLVDTFVLNVVAPAVLHLLYLEHGNSGGRAYG